jgi:hypothetical protein
MHLKTLAARIRQAFRLGPWLESVIQVVSPKWAYRRAQYRAAQRQLSLHRRGGKDPGSGPSPHHQEPVQGQRDRAGAARWIPRT